MKTKNCIPGDPVWTNGVEILSNECLPVMETCQVSSILSTLELQDKAFGSSIDVGQTMDILILQNSSGIKLSNMELNSQEANNYMILKDDKVEQKSQDCNKPKKSNRNEPTNLEHLLYFVCNLCPFLCTSGEKISDHLKNAHSNKTIRKQLHLKCPACQNIFYHKISLRSHLIHDHGVSNSDINQIIQAVVHYAKVKMKGEEDKNLKQNPKESLQIRKVSPQKSSKVKEQRTISCKTSPNFPKVDALSDSISENTKPSCGLPQVNINLTKTEKIFENTPKQENPIKTNSKHIKTEKIQCQFLSCKIKMEDVNLLQYHICCHMETGFKCLECDQKFTVWESLAGHLWRSHKINMELHSCDECDYKTFSLAQLNRIHKLTHSDARNFICHVCEKGFKNRKQLINHRAVHRVQSQKFIHSCEICSGKFSHRRQVRSHMDRVHKQIKPFLCNFCGFKSGSRSFLKVHIRQHTGEKPFSCDICSYSTSDHNSLRRHEKRHTGDKPYKCPYCSYACIQSSTYKVHLKTKHPGQENNLLFTCNECPFRSINKSRYDHHMLTSHKHEQI